MTFGHASIMVPHSSATSLLVTQRLEIGTLANFHGDFSIKDMPLIKSIEQEN